MRGRDTPKSPIDELAREIDSLRASGEKDPQAACAEYGVRPKDYDRKPDDWAGAWDDYEEDRVHTILVRAGDDADAIYQKAELLWIARHPRF